MKTREFGGHADLPAELDDILVRAAGVDPAALTAPGDQTLQELGMESLAAMELQAVVKSRLGVQLPDELLELTVPQLTAMVRAQLPAGE